MVCKGTKLVFFEFCVSFKHKEDCVQTFNVDDLDYLVEPILARLVPHDCTRLPSF